MRLIFLNTGYGSGITGKPGHYISRFWRYIFPCAKSWNTLNNLLKTHKPHVLALAEADSGSRTRGSKTLHKLRALHGYHAIHRTKYRAKSFLNKLPILKNQCNAVLTSEQTLSHSFHDFSHGGHPLIIRTQIAADLTLITVHLALKKSVRAKQIKELGSLIKSTEGRLIIAGDFNTFAGAQEVQSLITEYGMSSANINNIPTFPAHKPHTELDYIFVCKNTRVTRFEILPEKVSDHLALLVEVE